MIIYANYRKLRSRSFYANDDLENVPGCAALRLQAAQALKTEREICLPQHSRENKGKVKLNLINSSSCVIFVKFIPGYF
jgi:hypothetical protein